MNRVVPIILAVLLTLSSPAAAIATGTPAEPDKIDAKNPVKPPGFNDTVSQLSLGDPDRTETKTPSISLGAALEMDKNEFETQRRMYTFSERVKNAKTREHKKQALIDYKFTLVKQLSKLESAERTAGKQFNRQKLTSREYARRLAILDSRAHEIERSISHMEELSNEVPRFSPEVSTLRADLFALEGPVRTHIAESLRGTTTPNSIYIATTNSGVVLSMVENDQYIREAYRADYRKPEESESILDQKAQEITVEQYPGLKNKTLRENTDPRYSSAGIWETDIIHRQGVVKAYLDSGTKEIFREIQYKDLFGKNHVPYGKPVRNNTTSIQIVVNKTYPGGPLRINVTDSGGDPVNGRISVGDTYVGETGSDGILWTVSPSRAFTVSAIHKSETVNVTLTPYGTTQQNSTTRASET
ncbi:DUF7096 domain-containing protein [Haladaptatus sp. NG-SE-30]